MRRLCVSTSLLLLSVVVLAGCGQKGPLVLPPPKPAVPAPAPTPSPAPTPAAAAPASAHTAATPASSSR